MFANINYLRYSLIKAINVYRPQRVIEAIYDENDDFLSILRDFLIDKIKENESSMPLKEAENRAFTEILIFIDEAYQVTKLEWNYESGFIGFKKYLKELGIENVIVPMDNVKEAALIDGIKVYGAENLHDVVDHFIENPLKQFKIFKINSYYYCL